METVTSPRDSSSDVRYILELLWVSGLALLCVLVATLLWRVVLGLRGEAFEWAVYLTLGTFFPAALLTLSLSRSNSLPQASARIKLFKPIFGVFFLLASVIYIVTQREYSAFCLAVVHSLLILLLFKKTGVRLTVAATLIGFLIIVTAWTTAAKMLWWESFGIWLVSGDSWVESSYRFFLCLASLLLVFFNFHSPGKKRSDAVTSLGRIANVPAVLLLAFASVRSDQLFNTMSYSHWSVITGPAQMIRQGAWILWDAPSQYGFLNILATAMLPVSSVWQSAYIINSILLFCSATAIFFVLRLGRSGLLNFGFALAATLAAVFLMAGWPPALLGPQVFPSLGPFRFIWCFALVLILLLESKTDAKPKRRVLLFVGCIGWVIATLWSSESAAYAAACWLPSYALLIYQLAHQGEARRDRVRVIGRWAMLPPMLLAISVAAIAAFYFVRLGHGPDWNAFYEYSMAFAGGFFSIPIDINGPVSTIFLVFCAVSTAMFLFLRRGLKERDTPLMVAVWGLLWAVSSYFVSRSHANNATVLTPLLCLVMGLTIYLLTRHRFDDRWTIFVRSVFVPVFALILITTFGNAGFLRLYLTSSKLVYEKNIDTHLPTVDPGLLELLKQAQVKPSDPIVYSTVRVKAEEPLADGLSHDHGVLLPAWRHEDGQLSSSYRSWLPTTPFVLLVPLPAERKQQYMQRFVSRARLSGWMIQNKREAPYTSSPWFYEQVLRTHSPTKVFENNNWQLIWFEFKPAEH